jgi:histidinol-phosphate aminotransferase
MSQFWSPIVHKLTPYVPGEQPKVSNLIKLNTNENPYGPSEKVLSALKLEASDSLRLYPDPNASELKSAIAEYYSVKAAQVFVGNGSDEVLAHTFMGLLSNEKPLLYPEITYSFYPVYCGLYGIEPNTIPLTESFEICLNDYSTDNGGIIFPNPNAPTGRLLPLSEIESLLKRNTNSVVVVDEAYIDFGGESAVALVNSYPNLLVIQTFSKSRSLAGLRVGFAIGSEELIEGLERVKNSFNSYPLDRFAIRGASEAIKDKAYFEECCQKTIDTRNWLSIELEKLGFDVIPSAANFVFAKHRDKDAEKLSAGLREQSIIVRHFKQERIKDYLRISIGTQEECSALVEGLKKLIN